MSLTPRKQKILASIVKYYVKSGEPVGSKMIADEIGVSSATVRNEMAELIELGLLEQPHTSAGRIPSSMGYREYINHSMEAPTVSESEKLYFDSFLSPAALDSEQLLLKAAAVLSGRFTSAVTTPSASEATVRAVQFVQISRRTAMLILLSSAGTMNSKLFHADFDLTPDIMRIFFRAFNERITGRPVSDITPAFVQTMGISFGDMAMLMTGALVSLLETAGAAMKSDLLVSGQTNLLLYREFAPQNVRSLISLLDTPEDAISLLMNRPQKTAVLLGNETNRPELRQAGL
ncbi:MAG: heat-inducible transcriptional repressor HrcA, partial [Oscillospiraceae bacterium]